MVGIVTRKDGYNIGSSLQAYAIQHAILSLGFRNEIINYCEYSIRARMKYFLLDIVGYITQFPPFSRNRLYKGYLQRRKFQKFEQNLIRSKRRYYYRINKNINGLYDHFVCGSDQIWNPHQYRKAFLLDFVDADKVKIAYAPSFGIVNDRLQLLDEMVNLLRRFNYLSCREAIGKEYIEKKLNRTCELVLDPTLLIERAEWESLESRLRLPYSKYILCYILGDDNFPSKFIRELSQKTGLAVVNIHMFYKSEQTGCINIEASPTDFLYLVHNADIVCTNSYHGTLFSFIYQKLVYVFNRKYQIAGYDESSRFISIFSTLGFCQPILKTDEVQVPYHSIDYEKIEQRIIQNVKLSKVYLKKALQ